MYNYDFVKAEFEYKQVHLSQDFKAARRTERALAWMAQRLNQELRTFVRSFFPKENVPAGHPTLQSS